MPGVGSDFPDFDRDNSEPIIASKTLQGAPGAARAGGDALIIPQAYKRPL